MIKSSWMCLVSGIHFSVLTWTLILRGVHVSWIYITAICNMKPVNRSKLGVETSSLLCVEDAKQLSDEIRGKKKNKLLWHVTLSLS